jgi:flagellar biosynthesis protein FlhA
VAAATRPARPGDRLARTGIPLLVVGIVVVMVVPLPAGLLDLLIAANLSLAVVVLVTAMLVEDALEFSVFPALLLVTTLLRLSLNVSTTRLILLDGFAGRVIEAFGGFVVGGNLVVGLVIFLILVVIQFAVITAGAGRVAEVAARFTLDAMPGKQMAIDADLNSGLITETEARRRREEIAREADFYGAMDGASKFVKGDAIAAVVIVVINLLGGFAVGVLQHHLSVGESIRRFALLSVGDGLVSQIPALLISVAAGIVVTRTASENDGGLGADLWAQLLQSRRVLGIAAAAVGFMAVLPGLPKIPFAALAAALAVAAARRPATAEVRRAREEAAAKERIAAQHRPDTPEAILAEIGVEPLELELAPDLFDLVDQERGGNLLERVKALRRQIASDLGLVVPLVRTRDNLMLPPSTYVIRVHGVEVGRGEAPPGCVLVLADGDPAALPGRPTREPVFGLPAAWVPQELSEAMESAGHVVVDRGSVLVTHLSEVVRTHAADLLSRQDVQALVDVVRQAAPALANDIGTDALPLAEIQRVLRGLLAEGVPIRNLVRILEAVTAKVRETRDPEALLEAARQALGPVICAGVAMGDAIHALTLDPLLEQALLEALRTGESGSFLALDAVRTERLIEGIAEAVNAAEAAGRRPVILCSAQLRPALRRLIAAGRPSLPVLSYAELSRNMTIEPVGVINLASHATAI